MPFVRHELGTRLRLRRIPDLHVRLDDTIERGTRVLHLLEELEAGRTPVDDAVADAETLPTPVRPAPSRGRPRRRTAARRRASAAGPPPADAPPRDEGDVRRRGPARPGEPAREAEAMSAADLTRLDVGRARARGRGRRRVADGARRQPREPRRRHARGGARGRDARRGPRRPGHDGLLRPGAGAVRLPARRGAIPDRSRSRARRTTVS